MGQYKVVIEHKSRKRWAAYGFLLIVALLIISWFLAPTAITISKNALKQLGPALSSVPQVQQQIVYTLIIFFILAIVTALIVALAAPKRPLNVSEKDLIKEREATERYKRMARKRQRTLNREMREYVEKNQK
ncbi:MAG: hypothetical protein U0703_29530 [Anaerolineae bacterium]